MVHKFTVVCKWSKIKIQVSIYFKSYFILLLDIFSGNQMGDLGARMLSKALQINNKLKTIFWDKNNTSCQGFEDVAVALEK